MYEAGAVFDPKVLDITDKDLESTVQLGIKRIAAACLALNYPTLASIPHSVVNGYKNVLAVSVETDYTFPLAEKVCSCLCSIVLCMLTMSADAQQRSKTGNATMAVNLPAVLILMVQQHLRVALCC